ncbi:MAG: hypothetical protein K2Y01_03825 [Rhabdochlamydiaceae bacterium]|nr:hypothetical protein [Rhabdochlamydiaceae bacterium]
MNSLAPQNTIPTLLQALSQKEPISQEAAITLQQINTLQHAGLIPPFEALLIKNNLNNPLFAEGILSDLILNLVQQGTLAPEMKQIVAQRKLQGTIRFLYTCHLEQTYSTLEPYILQQKLLGYTPKKLLIRMQEAEEMESKKYIKEWLQSLNLSNLECQQALAPLLKPLTWQEFKQHLLKFLDTLRTQEEEIVHQFCLKELYSLLQAKSESSVFFTLSQFVKAFRFYKKYADSIEKKLQINHQFSFCVAADAIKNGPYSKELPTYYHLIYGKIKNSIEEPKLLIVQGSSPDDKNISTVIQSLCNKIQKPFSTLNSSSVKSLSSLVQALLKKAPESIAAPISEPPSLLLEAAKALHIPMTFFPSYTNANQWEDISQDSYSNFRIAFPTPLPPNTLEEIQSEKTTVSGIPCVFSEQESPDKLKQKWGFTPETKVIILDTPEGNSPWPALLSKEYTNSNNLALIVLTDEKNASFIHTIKTKIRPQTNLPIQVYSSLTPQEREELLTLSDLLIARAPENSHTLLFEAQQAKTPVLLDRCPPPLFSKGILGFFRALGTLFHLSKENPEKAIQEKIMSDLNLGLFIRSPKNFKSAVDELLTQTSVESPPTPTFSESAPLLLQKMQKEAFENKQSPLHPELSIFTIN